MVWELVPGVWKEIVTGGKGSRVDFVKNTKVSRKREALSMQFVHLSWRTFN